MLVQVLTPARTRFGKAYPAAPTEYAINFNDDKSITIHRNRVAGATFQVGDTAEYNSFNLRYTGTIRKITNKAVTIAAYPGTRMEKIHRLNLNEFSWRNFDFNLAEVQAENASTMMYI